MKKIFTAATLAAILLAGTVSAADARRWNPPGPRGGPGTNWHNPPGPHGGPGASRHRWWEHRLAHPGRFHRNWGYFGFHGGLHWFWHPRGYWCAFDNDNNPPGPRGGPGTNWENPPGPIGGWGASPNSRRRPC